MLAQEELATTRTALASAEAEREKARRENRNLATALEEERAAAQAAAAEAEERMASREKALKKAERLEAENAQLVERLMQMKMAEAEKMNEIQEMYEDLQRQQKSAQLRAMASDLSAASAASMSMLRDTGSSLNFPNRKRIAFRANQGGCHRVAFSHRGDSLITAGDDKMVNVWDVSTGASTGTLSGPTGAVLDAAFSHDDSLVLGAGTDKALRLWDLASSRVRHTMTGHVDKVCCAQFGPQGTDRAVSCSHDRTIKVWDLVKGFCSMSIMCPSNCNAVLFANSPQFVVSGHFDGVVRVWDLRSQGREVANEVKAHVQHVTSVRMMPDGQHIVTNSRDNTLKQIDTRTMQVLRTFRSTGYRVGTNFSNSCVSTDGGYVVAGGADGGVFIWSVADGGLKVTLRGHDAAVATCDWGPSGLATGDKNGNCIVWSD